MTSHRKERTLDKLFKKMTSRPSSYKRVYGISLSNKNILSRHDGIIKRLTSVLSELENLVSDTEEQGLDTYRSNEAKSDIDMAIQALHHAVSNIKGE